MNDLIYKKNLLSLASIDPELSFEISMTEPSEQLLIKTAKDGNSVPVILDNDVVIQLHSLFNPSSEAEKLYEAGKNNSSFVIIFGLGGGYHIIPYIRDPSVENILIIDTDKKYLRKILEEINLTQIFTSQKINLLIDPDTAGLEKAIIEKYLPSVHGNLSIYQLKNRYSSKSSFFLYISDQIAGILDKVTSDFTSQAYFGKRWFKNIISNMKYAEDQQILPYVKKKAAIVGAGPSLELQIDHLKKSIDDTMILASDTCAQYLIANNIIPDYIVSIDCQHITYNHLIGFSSYNIPIIMDLGSPVFLSRLFSNRVYFTSGNPLSRLIASSWRYFQYIDTAGGNVGYASLSAAASIGIDDITLYGIDYSYSKYKPYAKDTFLYKYFRKNAFKLNSDENSIYSFSSGSGLYEIDKKGLFSNKRMDSYHDSMISLINKNNLNVKYAPFSHRKIISNINKAVSDKNYNLFASGRPLISWKDFLTDYYEMLFSLPGPESPFNRYFGNLSKKEREIWTTIYPVCASFRKDFRENNISTPDILMMTRQWCLEIIEKTLSSK